MFCRKCGKEIEEGEAFCPECGTETFYKASASVQNYTVDSSANNDVDTNAVDENNTVANTKSENKKPVMIVAAIVIAIVILGTVIMVVHSNSPAVRVRKQLEIAQRYLEDLDYEQAIAAYEAAIAIDPKNEAALIGMGDAYIAWSKSYSDTGDYEKALEILQQGIDKADLPALDEYRSTLIGDYASYELDEGNAKLDEMEYDDAVAAYNKMLELDPMNVDAYLGLAEVHIRNNEYEEALEIAKKGYDLTGDQRLKDLIDMIESGNIFASNGWTMKKTAYDGSGVFLFSHEFTYNTKGQMSSVIWRDSTGEIKDTIEFKYDEKGRSLVNYGWSDGGILNRIEYEWSGNSRVEYHYNGNGSTVTSITKNDTDENGRTVGWTEYSADGVFIQQWVYEYDGSGREIKALIYDNEDGIISSYQTREYDADGKLIKYSGYNGDGSLQWYSTYEYDKNGRRTKEISYNSDGSVNRIIENS